MFQVRWRWNITRSLAVLRRNGSKRVPPHLQKFRSEDLLAAAFPETVGCLENHHGDVVIPDHPLVQQTMHDCLHEAMDVTRWLDILQQVKDGKIKLIARDTREPSPFCHELINAQPYAFLDGAPLEERRTRAIQTRRGPQCGRRARPGPARYGGHRAGDRRSLAHGCAMRRNCTTRSLNLVVLHEYELRTWSTMFTALVKSGRAATAAFARWHVVLFRG